MADSEETEVNGDIHLSKELPPDNEEEPMETEDAGEEEQEQEKEGNGMSGEKGLLEEEEDEEPIGDPAKEAAAVENGSVGDDDTGGDSAASAAAGEVELGDRDASGETSEKEHDSSEKEGVNSEKEHENSDKEHDSGEKEHDDGDKEHDSSEKEHDSGDKEHDSSEKEHDDSDKHSDGGGKSDSEAAAAEAKASASESVAKRDEPPRSVEPANGVKEAQTASPMEAEETTLSSDSDIEEIEQPESAGRSVGGANSSGSGRTVVVDTESLAGRSVSAAPRPPPLTRAPPPQLPQLPHNYHPQQAAAAMAQHLMINPSVLAALAQYGINTAGMTPEQLVQLQDYYRRSHEDTEYVLEAPSFIVPYVMESPAELSAKQFMTKVTEEANKTVENGEEKESTESGGGEKSKTDDKGASGGTDAKEADASKDGKDVDSNKENKPDKDASAKREEDFSHLGKWAYYYQAPVGQLLLDQGRGIVEEFIKDDLLKQQKRKAAKEKGGGTEATRFAIKSLSANLAASRKRNAPFRLKMTQCRFCAFETESILVMERHLEMPHMVGTIYQCNFCDYETRSPQVVLTHMASEHNVTGRLERAPASFQCPLCSYEDSGKARMTRHLNSCQKKFRIEKNQCLDDWVPPAKVPKIHRGRPNVLGKQFEPVRGGQPGVSGQKGVQQALAAAAVARGRGRPVGSYKDGSPVGPTLPVRQPFSRQSPYMSPAAGMSPQMTRAPQAPGPQMLMPPHYQIGNQIYQLVNNQLVPVNQSQARSGTSGVQIIPTPAGSGPPGLSIQATPAAKSVPPAAMKLNSTPSISITPVPRPSLPPSVPSILRAAAAGSQLSITKGTVGTRPDPTAVGKGAFVICEICDGYIKDLEQLRNHMQWIHKVKIHPKMIYNRPPLNCQKCQLRFFTDQGLERHLLGSHGLVTSSMQEAANKGHDSGRCPICGKVYQWKLLHHVSKDHHVTLKPAHLSYKCTVCTATFSMYKQFENHVYSSHSVVAKKIMESSDRKKAAAAAAASGQPIKLNDEITIIPHPSRPAANSAPSGAASVAVTAAKRKPVPPPAAVELECQICDHKALPRALNKHYSEVHLGRCEVEFTPVTADPECAEFVTEGVRQQLAEHAAEAAQRHMEVELSDPEEDGSSRAEGGGGALSKLNKDITITPIGGAARPRRIVTIVQPRRFTGPLSAKRRRRARLAPRSVKERRRGQRESAAGRRRNPSVVELSDTEQPETAETTVDLVDDDKAEGEEVEDDEAEKSEKAGSEIEEKEPENGAGWKDTDSKEVVDAHDDDDVKDKSDSIQDVEAENEEAKDDSMGDDDEDETKDVSADDAEEDDGEEDAPEPMETD